MSAWTADAQLQVRAAQAATARGGTEIRVRDDAKAPWRSWLKVGPEEILSFDGFTADGKAADLISSIGSDNAASSSAILATGEEKVVASSDGGCASGADPSAEAHLQAVSFDAAPLLVEGRRPDVKADFDGMTTLLDGDFEIVNRDAKDAIWLVAFTSDRGAGPLLLLGPGEPEGHVPVRHHPRLEGLPAGHDAARPAIEP